LTAVNLPAAAAARKRLAELIIDAAGAKIDPVR
jgi:hypothetical protein